jgi:hypothetical protein
MITLVIRKTKGIIWLGSLVTTIAGRSYVGTAGPEKVSASNVC